MNCSELAMGLTAAICEKNATRGAEGKAILIPFNAIDRAGSTVVGNVISKIARVGGKVAYEFETFGKSFDEAGATFAVGTYRNSWTHSVPLRIFVKSEDVKEFVNVFGSGAKCVVVLKNNDAGIDQAVKFEAYGWDNGLVLTESAPTLAMADGVVYPLTLASAEGAGEGSLPKSVFSNDILTTEKMLQDLTQTI